MRESQASFADSRGTFIPGEFHDLIDVAECALDEQLEQLQRQYAAATRAASRARQPVDPVGERLLAAIDALEARGEEK